MLAIDLSGRTAVVTGATGQLGRVMVRTLARAGADVAIHYHRKADMAESLRREVTALGVNACVVQADVTKKAEVLALRDAVRAALGPADILVNNSVIQYKWTSVLEQAQADYESQFQSSVLHNVFMAQAFVPDMIAKKWGRIVGINTECSMQCRPGQSAYVSGKRGMDGVLRVLAREVAGHGITVNQVAPGWVLSEDVRESGSDGERQYREGVPLQRRGTDQEIANAVVFLASELAGFVTGVYLPVCGGNVMPSI